MFEFNKENIESLKTRGISVGELSVELNSEPSIFNRKVSQLFELLRKISEDCRVTRRISWILDHLSEREIIAILENDVSYFRNNDISQEKKYNCLLNAALVASKDVVEFLQEEFKPLNQEKEFFFCVFCSGDDKWFEDIILTNRIAVKHRDYSLMFYAKKLQKEEILEMCSRKLADESYRSPGKEINSFFWRHCSTETSKREEIKGELLVSFNEIILGLLESLCELKDKTAKNILLDILFSSSYDCKTFAAVASELDQSIGEQICVLYSCMHPDKWNEPYMSEYKKTAIMSYVSRSLASGEQWLYDYAQRYVLDFLRKNNLGNQNSLTCAEERKKQELLTIACSDNLEPDGSSTVFEDEVKAIDEIYSNEYPIGNASAQIDLKEKFKNLHNGGILIPLPDNIMKLDVKINSLEWQQIYKIIGKTTTGKQRKDEEKMFRIFKAIQYKQKQQCHWKELPQHFPRYTTVRHYYYDWVSNENILRDLKKIGTFNIGDEKQKAVY